MGIKSTIDFVIDGTLDLAGLVESSDRLPMLTYDEKHSEGFGIFTISEYIFREGGGNDYLDMDRRDHDGGQKTSLIVYGGGGQDYIANVKNAYGEDDNDQIKNATNAWGGKGDDYITDTTDKARGEDGDDYIKRADTAYGGNDNDFLVKNDDAHGEDGEDVLIDNKRSFGGDDNDYIIGRTSGEENMVEGFVDWATERLTDNDVYLLDGGAGDDYLEGKGKDEVLKGGTGSDVLIGGGGNDAINGGEDGQYDNEIASDLAVFRNDANFTFTKESGTWDYKVTGQGTDYFKNIESVIVEAGKSDNTIDASALEIASNLDGRAGNDIIKGGDNSDMLFGGLGNDWLSSGKGTDYLDGGNGNDILIGNQGNNGILSTYTEVDLAILNGEIPASHRFIYEPLKPIVTIWDASVHRGKSHSYASTGSFTDYELGAVGKDDITSLEIADGYKVTLYKHHSNMGSSVTYRESTNKVVDWMDNEASSIKIEKIGPVTLFLGNNSGGSYREFSVGNYASLNNDNQVSSLEVEAGYKVTLFDRANYQGNAITYTSDVAFLGGFNNKTSSLKVEYMGTPDDVLVGGAGNDILDGGYHLDYLTGGTGADKFVFRNPDDFADVITDFNAAEGDQIWINRDAFSGNASYNRSTGELSVGGRDVAVLEGLTEFNVNDHVKFVTSDQLDAHMPSTEKAIGEYGTVNNLTHVWQTIELDGNYIDPVVITSDPTFNGRDFSAIRLRNVDSDSFEIRIQEAEYLNDTRSNGETVSFFVVEAGEWELADGTRIAAGLHRTDNLVTGSNDFDTVDFTDNGLTDFVSTPTVLSQIQTNGTNEEGSQWVTTRLTGQSTTGFKLGMQEEDALNSGAHVEETIGWLAIEQGVSHDADGDLLLQGGTTGAYIDENWDTITFGEGFDATPSVIAKLGSTTGIDPSVLRLDSGSISTTGFDAFVQEDQSLTIETGHTNESVSYLAFNGSSGTIKGF